MLVERRGPVEIRVGRTEPAGRQRFELLLEFGQAGDRQCALRCAVIGDRTRNHFVLTGFPGQLEVVLGQLPRALDRLTAAGGEEDAVQVARRVSGDPLGQLDRRWGGVGPQREERQLLGLLGGGLGELAAAMADLHHEKAG